MAAREMKARGQKNDIFNMPKENQCQPKKLRPVNHPSKNKAIEH